MLNRKKLSDLISNLKKNGVDAPKNEIIAFETVHSFAKKDDGIKKLIVWRNLNKKYLRDTSPTNIKKTQEWLDGLLNDNSRLIFILRNVERNLLPFGMIGISSFSLSNSTCFLESVMKFNNMGPRNGMFLAVNHTCYWIKKRMKIKKIRVNCFLDVLNAVSLYHKCNFKPVELVPLNKRRKSTGIEWIKGRRESIADRYYLVMEKTK